MNKSMLGILSMVFFGLAVVTALYLGLGPKRGGWEGLGDALYVMVALSVFAILAFGTGLAGLEMQNPSSWRCGVLAVVVLSAVPAVVGAGFLILLGLKLK